MFCELQVELQGLLKTRQNKTLVSGILEESPQAFINVGLNQSQHFWCIFLPSDFLFQTTLHPHSWPFMHPGLIRSLHHPCTLGASQVAPVVKNPPANVGDIRDTGSNPELGKSPGGGHGNPLQYSCLENPMDTAAWEAMVYSVAKSWTQLKWLTTHP